VKQAADGKGVAKRVEPLHTGLGLQDFGFDGRYGQGVQGSRPETKRESPVILT
jgi:hypothetical protein